jgi:ketosteroid isomerase-like protein
MKLLLTLATVLTLMVPQSWPQDPAARKPHGRSVVSKSAVDADFKNLPDRWKTAYNAKDAAKVAALYAPDGYYLSAHVAAHGRDEIRAYFQRGIDAGGHIEAIEILASGSSGNLAYSVGIYHASNAGQKVSGRLVVVAERIEGKWLIVAHESVVPDQP